MATANIIDHRTNKYSILVDAVFEPSCHDNSIKDATQFLWSSEFQVETLTKTTVKEAIDYANKNYKDAVTIYLYDYGQDPLTTSTIAG